MWVYCGRIPQAQVSLPQTLQAAVGRFPSDPSVIVFDGRLHHYDVEGDRRGRKNGWFVFYPTAALFGSFGSWKTGHTHTWRAGLDETLTPEQQARRQRAMAAIRARRAEEERALHAQARTRLPGGRGRGPPWPPIILIPFTDRFYLFQIKNYPVRHTRESGYPVFQRLPGFPPSRE